MTLVFESEYLKVEHDAVRRLVIIRRSGVRIPDEWDGGDQLSKLRLALLPIDRAHTSLLVDLRLATIRSDDVMDRVTAVFQDVTRGFRKTATLVRTATGMLQIGRAAREGNTGVKGFHDEAEALTYLLQS